MNIQKDKPVKTRMIFKDPLVFVTDIQILFERIFKNKSYLQAKTDFLGLKATSSDHSL